MPEGLVAEPDAGLVTDGFVVGLVTVVLGFLSCTAPEDGLTDIPVVGRTVVEGFVDVDGRVTEVEGRVVVVGLVCDEGLLTEVEGRVAEDDGRTVEVDGRVADTAGLDGCLVAETAGDFFAEEDDAEEERDTEVEREVEVDVERDELPEPVLLLVWAPDWNAVNVNPKSITANVVLIVLIVKKF